MANLGNMSRACACLSTVRRGMRLDLVSALLFYRCHLTHCVASFAGVSANKAFSVKVRLRSSVSTRKNQAKTFLWAKLHFFGYVATVSCTTMDFFEGERERRLCFFWWWVDYIYADGSSSVAAHRPRPLSL